MLAATLEEFVARGYAGLSIEEVAQHAGVNKTTIYRRWPARADLVRDALFSLRPDDLEPRDTGSLRDDLFTLLQQRAAELMKPHRRAIARALLHDGSDPELRAVMEIVRRDRPLVPPLLLERAIERGDLPRTANVHLMSDLLLGALQLRAYWRQEPIDDDFLLELVDVVVSGACNARASNSKPNDAPLSKKALR